MELTLGVAAHVDAGKTSLCERLLERTGVLRRFGRVDHGDAFLDDSPLERARGVTIYGGQASFTLPRAGGGTLTLMRAGTAGSGTISMTDAQLATLREGLPAGCRLYLTADRKEFRLKASRYALIMTIR